MELVQIIKFYVVFALCGSTKSAGVSVGFYSEALCPDCLAFSNGPLTDAFSQVSSIFTLDFIPWGNAKISSDGKFDCQHGEMECTMNTVQACALNYYSNVTVFWPFLHCLDSKYGSRQTPSDAKVCATELNMDWDKIDSCYLGDMGYKLELGYANKTSSLSPRHRYTPWITIDGEHNSEAEGGKLIKVICDKYKGPNIPSVCLK